MPALVDPDTLFLNMMLLIGLLFCLGILFAACLIITTFIRAGLWARARRKAEEKWMKYARRSDGRTYPPTVVGTCDLCRRGGSHIYAEYGLFMCAMCYDKRWQEVESWTSDEREAARAQGAQQPLITNSAHSHDSGPKGRADASPGQRPGSNEWKGVPKP